MMRRLGVGQNPFTRPNRQSEKSQFLSNPVIGVVMGNSQLSHEQLYAMLSAYAASSRPSQRDGEPVVDGSVKEPTSVESGMPERVEVGLGEAVLDRRLDKTREVMSDIASLERVVDDGQAIFERLQTRFQSLAAQLATVYARLDEMTAHLMKEDNHDAREVYECASCGSSGTAATGIRCTRCGHEVWWGWWPERNGGVKSPGSSASAS